MKISILLHKDGKQIIMTPENKHEKSALKMIAPGEKLEVVTKWGTMFDREPRHMNFEIEKCQGGYYRAFEDRESLMFVIENPPHNKEAGGK